MRSNYSQCNGFPDLTRDLIWLFVLQLQSQCWKAHLLSSLTQRGRNVMGGRQPLGQPYWEHLSNNMYSSRHLPWIDDSVNQVRWRVPGGVRDQLNIPRSEIGTMTPTVAVAMAMGTGIALLSLYLSLALSLSLPTHKSTASSFFTIPLSLCACCRGNRFFL